MQNKIIFVGGIHGVGKSTLCKKASNLLKINYLSASSLIDWSKVNNNPNKEVKDIKSNQNLLIKGLTNVIKKDTFYLLDGHFCLLNKKKGFSNIPVKTFQLINPITIILITEDVKIIKERLEIRDKIIYKTAFLSKMQHNERKYAKIIAKNLDVKYLEFKSHEFLKNIKSIKQSLNQNSKKFY